MTNIILSPCHYPFCSICFSWLFKRQASLSCESVLIFDFSIEINSEETRRHKRVGVKIENKLKFNSDAKYAQNNYSSLVATCNIAFISPDCFKVKPL